jgi:hypothetical protein
MERADIEMPSGSEILFDNAFFTEKGIFPGQHPGFTRGYIDKRKIDKERAQRDEHYNGN